MQSIIFWFVLILMLKNVKLRNLLLFYLLKNITKLCINLNLKRRLITLSIIFTIIICLITLSISGITAKNKVKKIVNIFLKIVNNIYPEH